MTKDRSERGSDGKEDEEGWFQSAKSFFMDHMDEQRMERLEQCRVLEEMAQECRLAQPAADRRSLEEVPAGIRMVRYFDWRNKPTDTCVREDHAVWACRAIALQCGSDLVELRRCFQDAGHETVLKHPETSYQKKKSSTDEELSSIPCQELQEKLGHCVAKNLKALAERMQQKRISKREKG